MEVGSYLKELKGTTKKKESVFQLFSIVKKLKNYGVGFLNFGEPIQLNNFLDTQVPDWRQSMEDDPDKKPSWLTPTVNVLANNVMERINQSAAISGMSLCALCLLSAKKHAMGQQDLEQAIDDYLLLLRDSPYSSLVSMPDLTGAEILANTLKLNKLTESEDSFGKIISLELRNAVPLTYYRNNILHLFALPGLIASIVFAHKGLEKSKILNLVDKLYPLLKKELFIYMTAEQAHDYADNLISSMKEMGMLKQQGRNVVPPDASENSFYSLWLLNRSIQETLHRYAVVLTLLAKEQTMSRSALEKQSRQFAERLAALHGISSPEFFDKNVLATFISALRESKLLAASEDGLLEHSESSEALRKEIVNLIEPEIGQRLEQIKG
jgi:glycerol-3-phosphate O-acyltransferase